MLSYRAQDVHGLYLFADQHELKSQKNCRYSNGLLVCPEDVCGVPDTLPRHLQDEHVVLLRVIPLLDTVHLHVPDLPVRLQAARGNRSECCLS